MRDELRNSTEDISRIPSNLCYFESLFIPNWGINLLDDVDEAFLKSLLADIQQKKVKTG
jgi:hypothetical protein